MSKHLRILSILLDSSILFYILHLFFFLDVHPDEAFSKVPYEKGSTFLWYLEEIVGELKMGEFLRFYYKKFALKSIDSDDFKETFLEYFKDDEAVDDIDWKTWLYEPGLPIWKPAFDDSLAGFAGSLPNNGKL